MTKIFIGSDHGGFELKNAIKSNELFSGFEFVDTGCDSVESADHPLIAAKCTSELLGNPGSFGILVCGSGLGMSIAANRVKGINAALCNSVELAKLARQHNGANILVLGARTAFIDDPADIIQAFLDTNIDMTEKYERRRNQYNAMND